MTDCHGYVLPEPSWGLFRGTHQAQHQLVIVGDGFDQSQSDAFYDSVSKFWDALTALQLDLAGAELDGVMGLTTCLFDVSTSSTSLKLPKKFKPPDPNPPKTVLDAYFGAQSQLNGLAGGGDATCALEALVAQWDDSNLPAHRKVTQICVLFNYPVLGGMCQSGTVWSSNGPGFENLMLHEFAHGLQLFDEYEAPSRTEAKFTPNAEKATYSRNISESKNEPPWKVDGKTSDLPTYPNPPKTNCRVIGRQSQRKPEFVGTFEGAAHYHCGLWRPSVTCRMRNYVKPFCRVCIDYLGWILHPNGRPQPS